MLFLCAIRNSRGGTSTEEKKTFRLAFVFSCHRNNTRSSPTCYRKGAAAAIFVEHCKILCNGLEERLDVCFEFSICCPRSADIIFKALRLKDLRHSNSTSSFPPYQLLYLNLSIPPTLLTIIAVDLPR